LAQLKDCIPPKVKLLDQCMKELASGEKSAVADTSNTRVRRARADAFAWIVKVIDGSWLPPDPNALQQGAVMIQNAFGPNDVAYFRWEANGHTISVAQTQTVMLAHAQPKCADPQPAFATERRYMYAKDMLGRLIRPEADVIVPGPTRREIERRTIMPQLLLASFERAAIREYTKGIHGHSMRIDSRGTVQNPKFWWESVSWWTDERTVSFYLLKTEGGPWAANYGSRLDEWWFEGSPYRMKRME
jgi:hypothetical protein